MEAITLGFVSNVASDTAVAGTKMLGARTTKARIAKGRKALSQAIDVMHKCESYLDPMERKKISVRIEDLKDACNNLPRHIGIFQLRLRIKVAMKAAEFMTGSLQVYDDALELSESSLVGRWVNHPADALDEPSTPRQSETLAGSATSIPTDDEPTTPRIGNAPVVSSREREANDDSEDLSIRTTTPPPSPTPSTQPLISLPTYPPAAVNPLRRLINTFDLTSLKPNGSYLQLKRPERS